MFSQYIILLKACLRNHATQQNDQLWYKVTFLHENTIFIETFTIKFGNKLQSWDFITMITYFVTGPIFAEHSSDVFWFLKLHTDEATAVFRLKNISVKLLSKPWKIHHLKKCFIFATTIRFIVIKVKFMSILFCKFFV